MASTKEKKLKEQIEDLRNEVSSKEAKISELSRKVRDLTITIGLLQRKIYGRMSEKQLPLDPDQLSLFDAKELSAEEKASLEKEVKEYDETVTRVIKEKRRPSRKPVDISKLQTTEEHIYPEGTTTADGKLRDEYVEVGTERTVRLELVPEHIRAVVTMRHKVILKSDISGKMPEERSILTPELPPAPIKKCIAGASILADIITGKFLYHLPFYRIIKRYGEAGFDVSDSTMGGWYEAAMEKLKLLYDELKLQIFQSGYIQIDETVMPVMDDEKHCTRKGYEWCVRDALTGDVMFHYDGGSRSGETARKLVGTYRGIIQSDGYAAYDQFAEREGITLAGCWAHARRYQKDIVIKRAGPYWAFGA